jgi:hypothetical protein
LGSHVGIVACGGDRRWRFPVAAYRVDGSSAGPVATIGTMATPEDRLTAVEDAVEKSELMRIVGANAGKVRQQRLEHALAGFRAEVAAEFGSFRADVDTRLGAIEAALAEVLRRLPEQP